MYIGILETHSSKAQETRPFPIYCFILGVKIIPRPKQGILEHC